MASRKLDFSPRKTLADSRGELWLEMKHDEEWLAGRTPSDVVDAIVGYAKAAKIGRYSGKSEGSGAFDVSFLVKNRKEAAIPLKAIVRKHFPGLAYSVSDEYEGAFHEEREPTLIERVTQLEQTAMYLYSALSELRGKLQSEASK